ncbi:BMP family ABC transporter substrate-binding protein [Martelella lutilitoris]|uniref:BMP family ABC transporter substrate-binding protein n=1 Tax=Martelella lutilitoris TaxID=2583532 RepID=A0A5C4JWA3_9HYPH|nr:BMP family protein [Martelella lutilitoris]TNB49738.1 BMP family ABC transporter substrate-binding protein [Martelella lutilitoris]
MMRVSRLASDKSALPQIAVVVIGEAEDAGFNASGLAGARKAARAGTAQISIIDGLAYDTAEILESLDRVMADFDGLVFIGGQGDRVMPVLALDWPEKPFAIVQGHAHGQNLASYDVAQEHSAYLAGCLAALMTMTGTVGHLSGHRVRPGLKGRAAFVQGVVETDPDVRVLTAFCGSQDDNAITRRWADAEIAAGADIIFTMLNGARQGAIDACRAAGRRQIGNALDWTALAPDVFVASALARIDLGVERAIADVAAGRLPQQPVLLGLPEGDYAALALGADVPQAVAERVAAAADGIRAGRIIVRETYEGAEFEPETETGQC